MRLTTLGMLHSAAPANYVRATSFRNDNVKRHAFQVRTAFYIRADPSYGGSMLSQASSDHIHAIGARDGSLLISTAESRCKESRRGSSQTVCCTLKGSRLSTSYLKLIGLPIVSLVATSH